MPILPERLRGKAMDESITKMKPAAKLTYDDKLWISTGKNRFDKHWKGKELYWSHILAKLSEPIRTHETLAEYTKMSKYDQDNIKDVGGFVGGTLKGGRRSAETVTGRTIISFDLDFAPVNFYTDYLMTADYASACYSTHKHRPSKPRLRLLIPLSRTVTPDEYEACARMLASDIGMDFMDPSTFQPSRLMYWPSCSEDAEYYFDYYDAPFLDPDKVLDRYPDWTDVSQWPMSKMEVEKHHSDAKRQADPTTKGGVIGAFCRAYDVPAAIATFLSDVYTPTDKPDRYTYAAGSTTAGLVLYEDGKFAYSNHATDPAGGQLCNSFDLVRIHMYGAEDEKVSRETPMNKLPSYQNMCEFAATDEEVKKALYIADHATPEDFDDDGDEEEPESDEKEQNVSESDEKPQKKEQKFLEPAEIASKCQLTKSGAIAKTVYNCRRVFRYDRNLAGIALNQLSGRVTVNEEYPVPWKRVKGADWNDTDDAELYTYVATAYAEFPRATVLDQKLISAAKHQFHPIRDYLKSLPAWDKVPRVDTLLIDYLGAPDNTYTRQATSKMLLAAVKRVFEPGCKMDNMLVISGDPGIGKSTIIGKLAGEWFSDSLTFEDMKDKTAAEKLQGYWIIEIPEMKGMKKVDVESVKSFLSRTDDIYRAAYAHNTVKRPRQSVFFGTVNDMAGYLKDVTGNRRFWPVAVSGKGEKSVWDIDSSVRDQIWAEVYCRYRHGERSLVLDREAEAIAVENQTEALEQDDREGMVSEYLDTLIPDDWYKKSVRERLDFLDKDGGDLAEGEGSPFISDGTVLRDQVSNMEIWVECFHRPADKLQKRDSYDLNSIMTRLGWKKSKKTKRITGYGVQRMWIRPEKM